MRPLIDLIISLFDLVEAELRHLRLKSRDLFLGLALILVAVFLACAGFLFVLGALFYSLYTAGMAIGWAALLSGGMALGLAGGLVWIAKGIIGK